MPMKWTPENVATLLIKILETHQIQVNPKLVAAAWPGTDSSTKPTPRAVSEQLVKLRNNARAGAGGNTRMSITTSANSNGSVTPSTPRTPRTPSKKVTTPGSGTAPGTGTGTGGKRKRGAAIKTTLDNDNDNDQQQTIKPDPKPASSPNTKPKTEPKTEQDTPSHKGHMKQESEITLPDLAELERMSPSKRIRKPANHLNMVLYKDEDEDESGDENGGRKKRGKYGSPSWSSSGSDFVPNEDENENASLDLDSLVEQENTRRDEKMVDADADYA